MSKYKVIKYFTDLQDGNHPYNAGDEFPRKGVDVSKARLKELSGNDNKQGVPLIEEVREQKPEEPAEDFMPLPETPTEAAEEKPKPKRSRKKANAE